MIITNLIQDTPEWHAFRKDHIMASEAAIIVNGSHFRKTKRILWNEKLGYKLPDKPNEAMLYGKQMEPIARQAYIDFTGVFIEPVVIRHDTIVYIGASLDGLSKCRKIAVEIKLANKDDHELAIQGKVPEKYYAQLQQQLDCLGHDLIHYWSFHNGEGVLVEVKRDDKYISKMRKEHEKFWNQIIFHEEPEYHELDLVEMNDKAILQAREAYEKVESAKEIQRKADEAKALADEAIDKLKAIVDGKSCKGGGFVLKKTKVKGRVNYKIIPELKEVNLESYRDEGFERWKFSKVE